jgi:Protein of unknown function (DUF1592)/Protein of unknown function (DUF1588)/Protein of unknown function (DUF1587)/Protein of unknown function (DUF1595)/Protein of unknown function (DUF1585)
MLHSCSQLRFATRLAGSALLLTLLGVGCTGQINGSRSGPGSATGTATGVATGGPGSGSAGVGVGGPGTGSAGSTGSMGVAGAMTTTPSPFPGPAVLNGQTPDQVLAGCTAPSPGRSPLRRLSNAEYLNTVSDLFSNIPAVAMLVPGATAGFPSEPQSLGFRNSADYLTVQSLAAQKYLDAAETLAQAAAASTTLVTCTGGVQDAKCASDFVASFGKKVYRRPLAAADSTPYTGLYNKAITSGYDFKTGIEWIVFAMLQSQQFLYRYELGSTPAGTYAKPSQYELASRLSYLYWQSMPDATLFTAADKGELATPVQIEAQARRLLADPRASRLLDYFDQWMDLDQATELTHDPKLYPSLDVNLPSLLQQETRAFVSDLVKSPTGTFDLLFTAPYTFMNAALAKHYGVTGPTGTAFQRVDTPGRSGVLTQGMMLMHDKPTRTSIVRRGLKVRTDVLCQIVPAPPPDVDINLDKLASNLTQRQRLEQHRQVASCAGCHNLMDPIGVVFEGFDAVGRPRTVDETGAPVETASMVSNASDANGPVADPAALGQKLAASDIARDCYVTNSFRFFYGREVETADACSMARLLKDFKGASYNLQELLVGLTRTDAFLYREVSP